MKILSSIGSSKKLKVMKKNYIKILAAAALVLLSACQMNEIGNDNPALGENVVAFSVGGDNTRSSAVATPVPEKGVVINLGSDGNGHQFYLEESVIDLNSPATRGTPAYTENVVTLYEGKMFAHSELGDDTYEYDDATQCYIKSYGQNIWEVADPLNFWMYMPVTLPGVDGDPTFATTSGKQTISFSYKSPATADTQADMVFAARSVSEEQYNANNKIADVLFQHALTGVKFAIGNLDDDIEENSISISKITFKGLVDAGNCVVTPTDESGKYKDVKDVYSSQATGVVAWTPADTLANKDGVYAEYDGLTTFAQPSEGNGSFDNNGEYPASFAAKSNVNNLNDGDATKTFWLIPQTMTDNVKLTINYSFGGDDSYEWTIDFGKALKNVEWKPGQLRTYTIRIDEVNVMIEDDVTVVEADPVKITYTHPETGATTDYFLDSYKGSKKEHVTITNTGNTDAYIRAAIVGQWLDPQGDPVFGFTDYTAGKVVLVDSWYQDQFVTGAQRHGKFEGLPGTKWVKGDDGYYYYTEIVPAGEDVPNDLFTSYTVGDVPGVAIAGEAPQIYFRLEIATQAISAKKLDGSDYTPYTAAWSNANSQE